MAATVQMCALCTANFSAEESVMGEADVGMNQCLYDVLEAHLPSGIACLKGICKQYMRVG
jgi:hypothetical protein